jgi:putative membrane protein
MWTAYLPSLNASLNTLSAVLLLLGFWRIRRKDIAGHRRFMISAFVTSTAFLVSYLTYHYLAGSRGFLGEGGIRYFYFTILISHSVLAAALLPLVLITLWRGLQRRYVSHRVIARWTFPIWVYVSVTGVLVYLMLYQLSQGR